MLAAAAVCPCPPLLVPEVAAGAAAELDGLRTACSDAVAVLAAARPDRLLVIGPAGPDEQGPYPSGAAGSFRGFGVDRAVRLGKGDASVRELPSSLAVAAWLLEHTDFTAAPVEGLGIDTALPSGRCAALGRESAAGAERLALLVMGDGSACRTLKAPGYLDDRAADFDAGTARALGAADTEALLAVDERTAHELKAAGRAPWQVLAGAAEGAGLAGTLLYDDAPYGVGYSVAVWS
ncbi:class III extradiol dioxygenase subunit B-like domain-containing protein [Streptomyces sp. NPDC002055]|uniref:class III extradiol dioxygenase subunit B-like domain-containing protein n=1 Tax=Streptomyces sp. NPDC002055 TaxID=3154534 RepID=UPI00331DB257